MHEKFKYDYNEENRLLYKYYYGLITLEDIITSWLFAFDNNIIPNDVKGFILDYKNANFNIPIKDHIKIAEFYQKHLDVFANQKIAIITDNPQDIRIPPMVSTKDDGFNSKAFTTLTAAINWILY